jgi:predicted NBD/HSP70 family sugar kinase
VAEQQKFNEALFRTAQIVRRAGRVRAATVQQQTRLRPDTVLQNLGALETAGLIEREAERTVSGDLTLPAPRNATWRLQPALGYTVGVCIERDRVVAAAFDLGADIRTQPATRSAPGLMGDPDAAVEVATSAIFDVLDEEPSGALFGIGIAIPTPVERARLTPSAIERRDGRSATRLSMQWRDRYIGRDVQAALSAADLSARVSVDNDASLGALGRFLHRLRGEGDPDVVPRDIAYVHVGAGVGMGLVLKGKHVRGGHGLAGELGHTRVDAAATCPRCNRPCLESVASLEAIRTQLARDVAGPLKVSEIEAMLTRRRRSDDPDARGAVWTAGAYLGRALGLAAMLVDPSEFVIGGPIVRFPAIANVFDAAVRHSFEEYRPPLDDTEVELRARISLDDSARDIPFSELLGAAGLAVRHPATDDWLAGQCVGLTARRRGLPRESRG